MKGIFKAKHVFVVALVISVFIEYAGLTNADVSGTKLTKPDQTTKAKLSVNLVLHH